MPLPRNDYVPQLAIVGNARLRGRDLRAQVMEEAGLSWRTQRLAKAACDARNAALNASS